MQPAESVDMREVEKDMTVNSLIDNAVEVLAWPEDELRRRLPQLIEVASVAVALSTIAARLQGARV